jgi:hypothetical protein
LALEVRSSGGEDAPSRLWQSRQSGGRIAAGPRHADFPALLAEALDTLAQADWEVSAAATRLGCSPSQLVKLIKLEPRAFIRLNRERERRKLRPLR